jgi:hypothetical protein
MIWLLIVITLNLETSPPQIHRVEVLDTFQNEKDCSDAHKEFFDHAPVIPDDFNLGCVKLPYRLVSNQKDSKTTSSLPS